MIVAQGETFSAVCSDLTNHLRHAPEVPNNRWQGVDVTKKPGSKLHELRNVVFELDLAGRESLSWWRKDIQPNLPWADDHFAERVGGQPLNPGVEWANWPWGKSANKFRDKDQIFNHTYMERLWPKYARQTAGGKLLPTASTIQVRRETPHAKPHKGIALEYGDLQGLVELLAHDPGTRQAWIPLFFPEDTGRGDDGRKPCTLGYQFLLRDEQLHIWYPLRSCDITYHFRDDCYLAVRLLCWVLEQLRIQDDTWNCVTPGTYSMHVTSLHIFENDWRAIQ